ncbi:MAG: PBP1A family penicillin-binding protein [Candidatus Cloacimonetes bacterium]|nr:PBP1A family penicillin-binding protein [Candidatus Cloacimonadota bacterium]
MKFYIYRYLYIMVGIVFLMAGVFAGLFFFYSNQLPPLSELQRYDMKTGSEVYDINDRLIHVFAVEHRRNTDLSELPDYLIDGLLAVEDRRFYSHWGVDLYRTISAILIDLRRGDFSQGGSTITQQLARNMFLTFDKQIPRKIKEMMLAVKIEQNYSKYEILEMYLDKVYLGAGVYGVEAASHRYFNKDAQDLTISEAAMIIGLIQLPSAYSPISYPDRAIRRRNTVLYVMYDQGVINEQEYRELIDEPIILASQRGNQGTADYFLEHIRLLVERKYGTTRLFTEGLKIYTTLDYDLQIYADSLLNNELTMLEQRQRYPEKYEDFPPNMTDITTPYIQGGVLGIEPQTGYVRVMIGGRNFNHSKFNRVTQARRQPGSAFKPILYTAALDYRYTPATIIKDEPVVFVQSDSVFWKPRNYSQTFEGYVRLREALNKSINTAAVKVITDIGPSRVVDYGRRFGLTTPLRPYYSLAIGSFEVIPMELVTAYTTFANNGTRVTPIFVRRIEDKNGNLLEMAVPEHIRVVDDKTAYLVANLLQTVVDEGTGRSVRTRGYRWFAAGKTGTTDDYRDAWFIGFNKQLVLGIWVGFDDNTSMGRNQTGAVAALPSWPPVMQKAIERIAPKSSTGTPIVDALELELTKPNGIITQRVSARTGLLPRSLTEASIEEYFIAGTEPTLLSDSLRYNFHPSMYRENLYDSLIVNLGGRRSTEQDSISFFDQNAPNVIIPRP